MKDVKTTVRMPRELWKRLKAYAVEHDKNLEMVTTEALLAFLSEDKKDAAGLGPLGQLDAAQRRAVDRYCELLLADEDLAAVASRRIAQFLRIAKEDPLAVEIKGTHTQPSEGGADTPQLQHDS